VYFICPGDTSIFLVHKGRSYSCLVYARCSRVSPYYDVKANERADTAQARFMYILSNMPHEIKEFILARIGENYKQALHGETLAIPSTFECLHAVLYKPKIITAWSIFYAVCEQTSGLVKPFEYESLRLTDANLAICTEFSPSNEYEEWGEVMLEFDYGKYYSGNIRGYPELCCKSSIPWAPGSIPFISQMGALVGALGDNEYYSAEELNLYTILLTKGEQPSTGKSTSWDIPYGCRPPFSLENHHLQPFACNNDISHGPIPSVQLKNSFLPDAFDDAGVFIQWARMMGHTK